MAVQAAMLASLVMVAPALAGPSPTGATIASDKADYAPGETVTLTGTGWASGEAVRIVVNDTYGASWQRDVTVTATEEGGITDAFSLPNYFVSDYDVTASGPVSGSATTAFTDLSIGTYDQCSNDDGDGYATGDLGCRWINGNLQANNSTYAEGDATVQRLWLTGFVPGSSHSVTLVYGTTKAGTHAYDYLTQFDWSEDWITLADRCQDITGCTTAGEDTEPIPNDPNVPDSIEGAGSGSRVFTMRGGTMVTPASTPAIISGTYAGDSETAITVFFTVANSGDMCVTTGGGPNATTTCAIALWFGAHVGRTDQWTAFNGTTGAGDIEGSPYHVSLDKVDGASVGERDNQMQANTIVAAGSLVLSKVLGGSGASAYTGAFDIVYNCGAGAVTVAVTPGTPVTIPDLPAGTVCTVTEPVLPVVPGYTFGTPSFTDNSGTANDGIVTIVSAASVTVTTNNTLTQNSGSLVLSKVLGGTGASAYTGAFDIVYNCGAGAVTVAVTPGTDHTVSGLLSGTVCTVTEPILPVVPGYTFGTPSFTDNSGTANDGIVTIGNAQNSSVTVTTNNTLTQNTGSLVLSKVLGGTGASAYTGAFDIVYNCGAGAVTVAVTPGTDHTVSGLLSGTVCTVTEPILPVVPGYTFGTPSFTDNSGTANDGIVTIGNAQNSSVTVTTNNTLTQNTGSLVLSKVLGGPSASGYTGAFDIVYNCGAGAVTVAVTPGTDHTVSGLLSGTVCTVTEPILPVVPGYTFGTPSFTDNSGTANDGIVTIGNAQNSSVTVTTNNTLTQNTGSLVLSKVLGGTGASAYTGAFDIVYNCGAGAVTVAVTPGTDHTVSGLLSGTVCTVTEPILPVVPGYTFGTPSFTDNSGTANDGIVTIGNAQNSSVTVTTNNTLTQNTGSLVLSKVLGGPSASGYTGAFDIVYNCGAGAVTVAVTPGTDHTVSGLLSGTVCTVTEPVLPVVPGYDFGTPTFTDNSGTANDGIVTIGNAQNSSVTVTTNNTLVQRARVSLFKTISGRALLLGETALFQARQGATTLSDGTILNAVTVDSNSVFPLDLFGGGGLVVPGDYQICEFIFPGWDSTIRTMPGAFVPNSLSDPANTDNAYVCINVTLAAGQTYTLTINNTPPPGGMAKTIGFWKNHAACKASNGNQQDILGQTLALAPIVAPNLTRGFYVGDEYVDTCNEAVLLLNKSDLSGKKQASLPEFNFASQYTAYQLNLLAGAANTAAATAAAAAGQAILDENGFIGNALPKNGPNALTAAEKAALNTYAGILDNYNNNI